MYKGKYASELSMSEVKKYYDELRENGPCTDEQWADFNILKEKLIVFAYKILDGKTNGKVFEAPCDDAVSREEIKKIAKEMYLEVANMKLDVHTISDCISYTASKCRQVLIEKLESLPPATLIREHGELTDPFGDGNSQFGG